MAHGGLLCYNSRVPAFLPAHLCMCMYACMNVCMYVCIRSFIPDISIAPLQVHALLLLLLRGAPENNSDTVSELTRRSATGNCNAQGPYSADIVRFEPATLRTQDTELNTDPQRPTSMHAQSLHFYTINGLPREIN